MCVCSGRRWREEEGRLLPADFVAESLLLLYTVLITSFFLCLWSLQPAAAAAMVASSVDSGGGGSLASLCQRQQRCVKASMGSGWRLAEAQHQLCSMELHGSESQEQERARASACPSELSLTEEEWRRKEGMLGGAGAGAGGAPCDASHSPVLGAVASWDVFDKVGMESHSGPY